MPPVVLKGTRRKVRKNQLNVISLQSLWFAIYLAGSPFASSGIDRNRTPLALKIAFATAGAIPVSGVSPAPIDG